MTTWPIFFLSTIPVLVIGWIVVAKTVIVPELKELQSSS
jgi:hypothetical protein